MHYFSGRLFFDHLPKTAGTAVTQWFINNFGSGTVTPISQTAGPHLELIAKYGGIYPIISAHTHFIAGDDLDPRWDYITVLREPIERCLSWMRYLINDVPKDARTERQINGAILFSETFGQKSTPEFTDGISNLYTRHFSSIGNQNPALGSEDLALALKNLKRYRSIGFIDDLDTFNKDLCSILGFNCTHKISRENVTSPPKNSNKNQNPELISKIIQLNQFDLEFYRIARNQHHAQRKLPAKTASTKQIIAKEPEKYTLPQLGIDITNQISSDQLLEDVSGKILLHSPLPQFQPSQTTFVETKIFNNGMQVWGGSLFYPVNLSYHWFSSDGSVLIYEGERTEVRVNPMSSQIISAKIITPATAGVYKLMLTMVQERRFWFEDWNNGEFQPLIIDVNIN